MTTMFRTVFTVAQFHHRCQRDKLLLLLDAGAILSLVRGHAASTRTRENTAST